MDQNTTNTSSMATKRRLKYPCEFCGNRFATPQAKWGHLPHCPKRKLSLEPASKPEAQARHSDVADRGDRRPGPDSQESRLLLLETHELIQQLKQDARDFAGMAYLMANGNVAGEYEKAKEWLQLSQALDDVERDFDQMVGRLGLDRSLLFNIYHRMLAVQGAWLEYLTRDFTHEGAVTPEGEDVLRAEQARFADLILKIKRMLVAAR